MSSRLLSPFLKSSSRSMKGSIGLNYVLHDRNKFFAADSCVGGWRRFKESFFQTSDCVSIIDHSDVSEIPNNSLEFSGRIGTLAIESKTEFAPLRQHYLPQDE